MSCGISLCVCVCAKDGNPAGTIFAEDIVDVTADYEESKKDSKVRKLFSKLESNFEWLPALIFSIVMCLRFLQEEGITSSMLQANRRELVGD